MPNGNDIATKKNVDRHFGRAIEHGKEIVTDPQVLAAAVIGMICGGPLGAVAPVASKLLAKTFRATAKAKDRLHEQGVVIDGQSVPPIHWIYKWHTSLCSSPDEMEEYWARLLAGEFEEPGAFSRRTMSILSNMEASDAVEFSELNNRAVLLGENIESYYDKHDEVDTRRLVKLGLLETTTMGQVAVKQGHYHAGWGHLEVTDELVERLAQRSAEKSVLNTLKQMQTWKLRYFNNEGFVNTKRTWLFPMHSTTEEGKEIAKLVEATPIKGLWGELLKNFKSRGYEVSPLPFHVVRHLEETDTKRVDASSLGLSIDGLREAMEAIGELGR